MENSSKKFLEKTVAIAQAVAILADKGQQISLEKEIDLKKLIEGEEDPKIKEVIIKTMGTG